MDTAGAADGGQGVRGYAFGLTRWRWACTWPRWSCPPKPSGGSSPRALAGTLALTAVIGVWGDRIGRRRILVIGSALMLLSAVIPLVAPTPSCWR